MTSSDSRHDVDISCEQLRAYLLRTHWFEDGALRSVATIWHRQDNVDAEVVLPQVSAKDYLSRMRNALDVISSFEGRSVFELLGEVRRLFANVITIRVIHDDTSDGTIPISDGVLLIAKAKELVSAAARSLYAKRKQFTRSAPKEAREYLDTLLLGQTEVGSYVVNVIAPVQPAVAASANQQELPLAQAITSNLVTGLAALEMASASYQDGDDFDMFDSAVLAGASSNMCDALLGFSGANRTRSFEITVNQAPTPLFEHSPSKFLFNGNHVKVLERAVGYYKGDYILAARRLTGHITKLSRPKDETSGVVTIESFLTDIERKIQVELTGEDYHQAVIAHDAGKLVRVVGDVHVKSKSAHLLNPRDFGVIEIDDLL